MLSIKLQRPSIFLNKADKVIRKANKEFSQFEDVKTIKNFENKKGVKTVLGYDEDGKARYAFTRTADGKFIHKKYSEYYIFSILAQKHKLITTIFEKNDKLTEKFVAQKYINKVLKEKNETIQFPNGTKKESIRTLDNSFIQRTKTYANGDSCCLTKDGDKKVFIKNYADGTSVRKDI